MEIFHSMIQYFKEYLLSNPLFWGIVAVVLWITGSAFIKALRGKDENQDG